MTERKYIPEWLGWPEEETPNIITVPKEVFDRWQEGETVVGQWRVSGSMMSGGTVIEIVSKKGVIAALKRAFSPPKRVEPIYAPIKDLHPDFPGYVELRRGDRLIVYSTGFSPDPSSNDNPQAKNLAKEGLVFQHVRY